MYAVSVVVPVFKKDFVTVPKMSKIVIKFAVELKKLMSVILVVVMDQLQVNVIVLVTSKVAMVNVILEKFLTYVMCAVELVFQKATAIVSETN